VSVVDVRNIVQVQIDASPRLNVITGNNGQGKTSLLEAIYLLATTRSFRTARVAEIIRHGQSVASVSGSFIEQWHNGPLRRTQSIGLQGGRRTARLDGEAPSSLSHYATRSPVVVFDPQQMALSTGPAAGRRTLLDRLTLFTHPEVAEDRSRYRRSLRERLRVLSNWKGRAIPAGSLAASELDAFETLLAEHGAAITRARSAACEALSEMLEHAFARIAAPDQQLNVAYQPGGDEDVDEIRKRLLADRVGDAYRRRTEFGPHRDDLELRLDGHPARVVASQGQHRAITLALKSAELSCIAGACGVQPILLLDDVSSELDGERTAALFDYLATTKCQLFLTSTRRDVILEALAGGGELLELRIESGQISASRTTTCDECS